MKTNDGIPGSIFIKNNKYFIVLKGKKYYTNIEATKIGLKIAIEYKKKLYLESIGLVKQDKKTYYIKDLFKEYIKQNEINRDKKTIYLKVLSFNKIVKKNYEVNHKNIENSIIEYFQSENKNLKNSSINTYLSKFQYFLNWLYENNYLEPKINYKKKYFKKEIPKENTFFTLHELNKMLMLLRNETISKDNNIESNRHFADLIEFMFYTGARINETLQIKVSDVQTDRIKMYNKVNKQLEYIYLNEITKNLVNRLIKNTTNKDDRLFRWKSSSYLLKKLKATMKQCNIEIKGRNLHSLRKSYLRYLLKKDVPIEVAKIFMRHKNIKTTIKHYYSITEKEILEYVKNL